MHRRDIHHSDMSCGQSSVVVATVQNCTDRKLDRFTEKIRNLITAKDGNMFWRFDGNHGEWEAFASKFDTFGEPLIWRIVVCDDGTFDVSESDSGLLETEVSTFPNLQAAKDFCQASDAVSEKSVAYA